MPGFKIRIRIREKATYFNNHLSLSPACLYAISVCFIHLNRKRESFITIEAMADQSKSFIN